MTSKTYEERQAAILATMTPQQRAAAKRGAEVIIILDRVYVNGIDKPWPFKKGNKQ